MNAPKTNAVCAAPRKNRPVRAGWALAVLALTCSGCNDSIRQQVRQGALQIATDSVGVIVDGIGSRVSSAVNGVLNSASSGNTP